MSHANPHLAYRPDIDGLRAVAVLSVVVFHAFPAALPGGFTGVDIFFVISGYLISSIIIKALGRGEFSFADFYARRVRRIFPSLLLVLTSVLVLGWWTLLPDEYAHLAKHVLAGLGFVANVALWQESGYFDTDAALKPLLHLWSLGVEEQFYIVWPILALVAWRVSRGVGVLLSVLAAASLLLSIAASGTYPAASYFLPAARAWELLLGAALAWRLQRYGRILPADARWTPTLISVLGAALLATGFAVIDKTRDFPGAWALLPVVGAVLIAAAGPRALVNRVLAAPPFVRVGLISYPLYLWHWPLLAFARVLYGERITNGVVAACVALSLVLAWASYRFVEIPARRDGRRAVLILLACAVVLAAVASNVFVRDGLAFRLKDAQLKQQAHALEWGEALRGGDDCAFLPEGMPGQCLVADPARAPTALIIGDSHANHYYWGLAEVLKADGENLAQLASGGCVPLDGAETFKSGEPLGCQHVVRAAIDFALASPEISTVFLAGRWVSHITGRELKDPPRHVSDERLALPDEPHTAPWGRSQVFEHALDRSLARLAGAGKRVVFLHAIPELPFNARECLAWNPNRYVARVPRPDCAVARSMVDARAAEFRPLLAEVLGRHPDVIALDPQDILCDAESCRGRSDGILLYRDDDHLSLAGSHWLAERLQPRLQELLRQ